MARFAANLLGWLAVIVMWASTFLGTLVAAVFLFGSISLALDLAWWLDLVLGCVFAIVWYWGGFFLANFLIWASDEVGREEGRFGRGEH